MHWRHRQMHWRYRQMHWRQQQMHWNGSVEFVEWVYATACVATSRTIVSRTTHAHAIVATSRTIVSWTTHAHAIVENVAMTHFCVHATSLCFIT